MSALALLAVAEAAEEAREAALAAASSARLAARYLAVLADPAQANLIPPTHARDRAKIAMGHAEEADTTARRAQAAAHRAAVLSRRAAENDQLDSPAPQAATPQAGSPTGPTWLHRARTP
jgi:hypothetical protein